MREEETGQDTRQKGEVPQKGAGRCSIGKEEGCREDHHPQGMGTVVEYGCPHAGGEGQLHHRRVSC